MDQELWSACHVYEKDTINRCTKDFIENFHQHNLNKQCFEYCPLDCDFIYYDTRFSTERLPSLGKIRNDSFAYPEFERYENVTKSFFSITVYYEDLQLSILRQQPKIEAFDFISSVGGLFSLFLGMSLLSFLEIFEIFYELFKTIFRS